MCYLANKGRVGIAVGARLNAGQQMNPVLDNLVTSGCQSIRMSAQWDRVEPVIGGGYDWSSVEPIVSGCESRGLGLVLEAGTRDNHLYASGLPAKFVLFHKALAQRYNGRIQATAGPNEPNHVKIDPVPSATSYTNLILKPSYTAINQVAPNLPILTGGLGGAQNDANDGDAADFLDGMYAAGAHGYFDALAFHPYTHPLSPSQSLAQSQGGWWRRARARASMVANGDAAKKIWITEYGSPTAGNKGAVTEAVQRTHLTEAINMNFADSFGGPFFWFNHYDDSNADVNNPGDFMGLWLANAVTHKLAWATFKTFANTISRS
jgi:hypothetical protein